MTGFILDDDGLLLVGTLDKIERRGIYGTVFLKRRNGFVVRAGFSEVDRTTGEPTNIGGDVAMLTPGQVLAVRVRPSIRKGNDGPFVALDALAVSILPAEVAIPEAVALNGH